MGEDLLARGGAELDFGVGGVFFGDVVVVVLLGGAALVGGRLGAPLGRAGAEDDVPEADEVVVRVRRLLEPEGGAAPRGVEVRQDVGRDAEAGQEDLVVVVALALSLLTQEGFDREGAPQEVVDALGVLDDDDDALGGVGELGMDGAEAGGPDGGLGRPPVDEGDVVDDVEEGRTAREVGAEPVGVLGRAGREEPVEPDLGLLGAAAPARGGARGGDALGPEPRREGAETREETRVDHKARRRAAAVDLEVCREVGHRRLPLGALRCPGRRRRRRVGRRRHAVRRLDDRQRRADERFVAIAAVVGHGAHQLRHRRQHAPSRLAEHPQGLAGRQHRKRLLLLLLLFTRGRGGRRRGLLLLLLLRRGRPLGLGLGRWGFFFLVCFRLHQRELLLLGEDDFRRGGGGGRGERGDGDEGDAAVLGGPGPRAAVFQGEVHQKLGGLAARARQGTREAEVPREEDVAFVLLPQARVVVLRQEPAPFGRVVPAEGEGNAPDVLQQCAPLGLVLERQHRIRLRDGGAL
mmetsp:Transcript_1826/g.6146  ORF Transcript_1826/g.6146 Transcript_1826/m.6146 type:complete len:520 (+) Transcript_1826:270-1829(+)